MNQQTNKIKYYQYPDKYNVGDTLSEHILKHFLGEIEPAKASESGKLLAIGSVMSKLQMGDVVWGTGIMRETDVFDKRKLDTCKFLAVRGKLTEKVLGINVGVYGDPALLLPLIYHPKIEKTKSIGYIPHYVDKKFFIDKEKFIDVALPWQKFIDEVLKCKKIVSSSLHGIVIAEAYGIPAEWIIYSDKVIGKGFKFKDYLTGTDREIQGPGVFPPIPNIVKIQRKLLEALTKHYGK